MTAPRVSLASLLGGGGGTQITASLHQNQTPVPEALKAMAETMKQPTDFASRFGPTEGSPPSSVPAPPSTNMIPPVKSLQIGMHSSIDTLKVGEIHKMMTCALPLLEKINANLTASITSSSSVKSKELTSPESLVTPDPTRSLPITVSVVTQTTSPPVVSSVARDDGYTGDDSDTDGSSREVPGTPSRIDTPMVPSNVAAKLVHPPQSSSNDGQASGSRRAHRRKRLATWTGLGAELERTVRTKMEAAARRKRDGIAAVPDHELDWIGSDS